MLPPRTLLDAMTFFPHTLDATASVEQARAFFAQHLVRQAPVRAGARILGVLDLVDLNAAGRVGWSGSVASLCQQDIPHFETRDRLTLVLETLAVRRASCAIVTAQEHLVGLLTTTDVFRLLLTILDGAPGPDLLRA
jgi:predicted transcriptional regulator